MTSNSRLLLFSTERDSSKRDSLSVSKYRSPLLFFTLLPGLARLGRSQTQRILLLVFARDDIDG